jgi:hypothetical protein
MEGYLDIMKTFLDSLYDCRFLTLEVIRYFFLSFFEIYRFLFNGSDDNSNAIFHKREWNLIILDKDIFNEKARKIVNKLLTLL